MEIPQASPFAKGYCPRCLFRPIYPGNEIQISEQGNSEPINFEIIQDFKKEIEQKSVLKRGRNRTLQSKQTTSRRELPPKNSNPRFRNYTGWFSKYYGKKRFNKLKVLIPKLSKHNIAQLINGPTVSSLISPPVPTKLWNSKDFEFFDTVSEHEHRELILGSCGSGEEINVKFDRETWENDGELTFDDDVSLKNYKINTQVLNDDQPFDTPNTKNVESPNISRKNMPKFETNLEIIDVEDNSDQETSSNMPMIDLATKTPEKVTRSPVKIKALTSDEFFEHFLGSKKLSIQNNNKSKLDPSKTNEIFDEKQLEDELDDLSTDQEFIDITLSEEENLLSDSNNLSE